MKIILSLLILFSGSAFTQNTQSLITGAGTLGQTIGSQVAAQNEYKQALIAQEEKLTKKGIKADLCKTCTGQNWDSVNGDIELGDCANPKGGWFSADEVKYEVECNDPELNNPSTKDPDCTKSKCVTGCESYENFTACGKDTKCKVDRIYNAVKTKISNKIDENIAACETYLKLKKSSGLGWAVAGDLLNLATLLGGALLAPGCKNSCEKDSQGNAYSDKDKIRCLCQTTSSNGKPCIAPNSSRCTEIETETCAEQMAKLGISDSALLASCECGKRNSVDPRGGWYLNEQGACVNNNNNNNNNYSNGNSFDLGYEKTTPLTGVLNTNGNNAASTADANKPSGLSSKTSMGTGLGARGTSLGNNDNKNKDKASLAAETGHGAGKASNTMAGGNEANVAFGDGQDFKVKKGAKPKDVAKADGESVFTLVSAIYIAQIDANALDSTRPMKKIERTIKTKTKVKIKGKKA